MILFDTTKTGAAGHRSGLTRVSSRLLAELGGAARAVRWNGGRLEGGHGDWYFTGELFSEEERPGFTAFLAEHPARKAALFHDAIPLKFPHITWPHSVARHPGYLKLLAGFDRVWAVSESSRRELVDFWRWQGLPKTPPVEVLALGADLGAADRVTAPRAVEPARPSVLSVGIVEPRKNQGLLLDVAEQLWTSGVKFDLHVVGRVNPHFGRPLQSRMKALRRTFPLLHHHESCSDRQLAQLFASARATAFPTIAEGCGLPLLESLWAGVPCVCSDLPVLQENAAGGGCVAVDVGDQVAWVKALRRILEDDAHHLKLVREAVARPLPTWRAAADALRAGLAAG